MIKPNKFEYPTFFAVVALTVLFTVGFVCAVSFQACTPAQEAKFVDAANMVAAGLEDYEVLHNDILSIHLLMQQGNYKAALKVANELLTTVQEDSKVEGIDQLRALVLLLESITKDKPQ